MKRLAIILLIVFTLGCAHYSWPPNEATIKKMCAEGGVNQDNIYFVFIDKEKGKTITSVPFVVIIRKCSEWMDVLKYEIENVALRLKIGPSYREEIHHRR